jgi:uncharacterized protein (TIGR03435 family)
MPTGMFLPSSGSAMRKSAVRVAMLIAVVAGVTPLARAQSPTPPLEAQFEVASIKPNTSGSIRTSLDLQPGGRFIALNVSVMMLVNFAYGDDGPLGPNRLALSGAWAGGKAVAISDHYDIQATAGRDISRSELMQAVRKLLVDRFKLIVHHEMKATPGYQLVLARADRALGPRLRRSVADCAALNAAVNAECGFRNFPGTMSGRVTMADFARRVLAAALEDRRPVENATALEGTYEFELDWAPAGAAPNRPADAPPAPPVDPNAASLFTALREQLGLKLEPKNGAIDVVVIEHAERPAPD